MKKESCVSGQQAGPKKGSKKKEITHHETLTILVFVGLKLTELHNLCARDGSTLYRGNTVSILTP